MTSLAQELRALRALKDDAESKGRAKAAADQEFKQFQAHCLERMEIEESDSFRTQGENSYLYSKVEKVKGQVEDRALYVRWALENDEAIGDFLDMLTGKYDTPDLINPLLDAITSTSVVTYKESQNVMNEQASAHVDDEAPLPPGLTFRPAPYISMTKS